MKGFVLFKSGTGVSGRKSDENASIRNGDPACFQELIYLSRHSLQDLVLFILVSMAFFHLRYLDVMAPMTEDIRALLGSPPPPTLSTVALCGYSISAAVLILARTVNGSRPSLKWSHFGFRAVFYLFFIASRSLAEHFMEVFIAGMLLIGLEQLNIWTYSRKILPRKRKIIENT